MSGLDDFIQGKLWLLGCTEEDPEKIIKWFESKYEFKIDWHSTINDKNPYPFYMIDTRTIFDRRAPIKIKEYDGSINIERIAEIRLRKSKYKFLVECYNNKHYEMIIERILDFFRYSEGKIKGPKISYACSCIIPEWKI